MVLAIAIGVTIFLNIVILTLLFYIFWKIKKIHIWQYTLENNIQKNSDNIFSQTEALIGLYKDLQPHCSLPKTRGWAGSPDFLWQIFRLAKGKKPSVVVECSSGVSTIVLAHCMKSNDSGHVYSMDHDPVFAEKTRKELQKHGLNDWATVIDAPIVKHKIHEKEWPWYSLDRFPKELLIDMIVVDGPPVFIGELARYPAGPLLFDQLKDTGIIVLDDAARDSEKKIIQEWLMNFNNLTQTDLGCEKGCVMLSK